MNEIYAELTRTLAEIVLLVSTKSRQLRSFLLDYAAQLFQDATLNAASPILRLTRAGETVWGTLPGDDWSVFESNHSTYEPLAWAHNNSEAVDEGRPVVHPTIIQVRRNDCYVKLER